MRRQATKRLACALFATTAVLLLLNFVDSAFAAKCPDRDSLEISDAPFDLSYESWKDVKSHFVIYGRCVSVLNQQQANIEWVGAQLKGLVKPDFPQMIEIQSLVDEDDLRQSSLRYGVEPRPERSKEVSLLINAVTPEFAMVASHVTQARDRARHGEALPESIVNAKSHAALNFAIPGGEEDFQMMFDFTSTLDIDATFKYRVKYNIDPISGKEPLQTSISLETMDPYLKSILKLSGYEGGVIVLGDAHKEFSFSFTGNPDWRTTQGVGAFDVRVAGEIVARFPVSYYAPWHLGGGP